ncbi:hypothetical protein HDV05_005627 [Chytridiales sp. JEL 0842]|nr:hypothetical protein HDV05_005627 [Chytridiales sp. JEL 0842]
MLKLIATTGLVILTYTASHLSGHFLVPFSFKLANDALRFNRLIFQHPLVETALGGVLVTHAGFGMYELYKRVLNWRRRQQQQATPQSALKKKDDDVDLKEEKGGKVRWTPSKILLNVHRFCGALVMVLLASAHIPFTRIFPLMFLKDPSVADLRSVAFSISVEHNGALAYVMAVYYMILSTTGLYHSVYGLYRSLQILGAGKWLPKMRPKDWGLVIGVGSLGCLGVVLGLAGVFERIEIGEVLAELTELKSQSFRAISFGLIRM